MESARVFVDWMLEHGEHSVLLPPPTPEYAIEGLAEEGAPPELLALYRVVSDDVPGLLPGRGARLNTPTALYQARDGGWVFGRTSAGDLVLLEGRVVLRDRDGADETLADSLEALLTRQLADLMATGSFSPVQLREGRILAEAADRAVGVPGALLRWTEEIVAELADGGAKVELPAIGTSSASRRPPFVDVDPSTGEPRTFPERVLPALRIDGWLWWRLDPDDTGAEPPRRDPVRIRSLSLSRQQGVALSVAVGDTIAEALLTTGSVCWPGLGRFTMSSPQVGQRAVPVFRVAPALVRRLNPTLSHTDAHWLWKAANTGEEDDEP